MLFKNKSEEFFESAKKARCLVVYHSADMDGRLGGAIAYKSFGDKAFYIGLNYQEASVKELHDTFPEIKEVYLIDYSFPAFIVRALLEKGIKVVFLDHHDTSMRNLKTAFSSWPEDLQDLFIDRSDKSCSGAMIAWKYFNGEPAEPYAVPYVVNLISTYDTWQEGSVYWQDALCLNAALYFKQDTDPQSELWPALLEEDKNVFPLIERGRLIVEINEDKALHDAKAWGGTLNWQGLRFFAMNGSGNSRSAEPMVDPELHDAILLFRWKPYAKTWKISLYHSSKLTAKPKLNDIAAMYGGGGHAGACGFALPELPFKIEDIEPLVLPPKNG